MSTLDPTRCDCRFTEHGDTKYDCGIHTPPTRIFYTIEEDDWS